MNPAASHYDVIIAGAGPTGLTLANILGMHGVRTLLVERNAATVGEPRAVSIDDETLRTMQFIDLVDKVKTGIVEGYGSHYFSPRGACFAKVVPDTVEYGYPRRSAFRQPILEAQLRDGLKRFAAVETRFSTRVTRIVEQAEGVRVTIADESGTREVNAQYVAACDGGRSGVREALGIALSGSTYDQRWLIVDLAGSTERFRHTRVYCDPARPALALPGPEGTRRYEFMMLPGESPEALLDEAHVRALLSNYSEEDGRLEIVRKTIYHFHARIAERWSSGPGGRILLAGDAAHLSPPFAGQGMNSGIRDAQNLGWKLAHVVKGTLGRHALDSYETERRPHAKALVEMAIRMGHVMMPGSALKGLLTRAAFRGLSIFPPARDYIMQMKYKPQPHFEHGLMAGSAGAALRGRMFSQPAVERADGSRVLLDHVLGKGFSAVELDDGQLALAAPHQQQRTLDARTIRVIPRDHRFTGPAEDGVERVRDVTGTIGRRFEDAGLRGVILRPDRYVAACLARTSEAGEADRLLDELARISRAPHATSTPTPAATPLDIAIA